MNEPGDAVIGGVGTIVAPGAVTLYGGVPPVITKLNDLPVHAPAPVPPLVGGVTVSAVGVGGVGGAVVPV